MTTIIPAILPKDYEDLKNKLAMVKGRVPIVQVDLCDGVFVKSTTWPFDEIENSRSHFASILREEEGMPFWEEVDFELDLMVSDAMENFDIYTKLGPRRIIFHLNSFKNLDEFKNFLEAKIVLVVDAWPDKNAVIDANKVGIPVIALCDTNNTANYIDLVIPCNNKGKKSLGLLFMIIAQRYMLARHIIKKPEDFKYKMDDFSDE